jgi:hypothetical protein
LKPYQKLAIEKVRNNAINKKEESRIYLEQICKNCSVDVEMLIDRVLQNPITINFHPDRFSNNGKTVLENLLEEGQYHSQFLTGTTNGGKTAFVGGDRFQWEKRLFYSAYPSNSVDRPKYGALNIFRYIDGASVRFGSCYFALKKEAIDRCTFSYGDSSTNPTTLCTGDTFVCVLADLIRDVQNNGKLLNQVVSSEQEALAILLNKCNMDKVVGRNLDYCIETHIHGDVSLKDDVDSFYMDESFLETTFGKKADELCHKYGIELNWIPKRQIEVEAIGELFRGPMIPILAKKIDKLFGGQGVMNAALLGQASRECELNFGKWNDLGSELEIFQYIKQLWHTIGYFG